MERKRRVVWSDDQVQALIDACIDLRNSDPEPSLLQIIKLTQEIIFEPKDRKNITTSGHVRDIIDEIKKRYGMTIKPVKYVDKYKELEERINALEQTLKIKPKIKIGIVGLKNNQYNELKSHFRDTVSLFFIDRDQSKPSLPSSVDFVVTGVDFVSHRLTDGLKNFYPKEQLIEVNGGIDTIKSKIEELMKKELR